MCRTSLVCGKSYGCHGQKGREIGATVQDPSTPTGVRRGTYNRRQRQGSMSERSTSEPSKC